MTVERWLLAVRRCAGKRCQLGVRRSDVVSIGETRIMIPLLPLIPDLGCIPKHALAYMSQWFRSTVYMMQWIRN